MDGMEDAFVCFVLHLLRRTPAQVKSSEPVRRNVARVLTLACAHPRLLPNLELLWTLIVAKLETGHLAVRWSPNNRARPSNAIPAPLCSLGSNITTIDGGGGGWSFLPVGGS